VLNRLREAQIHKDLEKYLNLYASTFPQREEKRAHTLKIWGTYDYTDLEYEVGEIKPLAVDQALARVTWHLQVRNLRNNSTRTLTQTFRVWFSREAGQWRIVRLEALSKEGGEVRKYAQAG
jgi:hypothetical protein